ncbi:MAG: cytochrome c4 [Gammaproteobacteria bacterium]|nr:cytochrome c4 [Gammaproteobacteria bacterium]
MKAQIVSALFLLTATTMATGVAQAAGDAAAGAQKTMVCMACHMQDGNSMVPTFPKLAGQHAEYISKQLHEFKSQVRVEATMNPMAAPLSDEDIADIAAHFASQKPAIGSANPDLVASGSKLYKAGNAATGVAACMACHGPNGSGNPGAKFPALAGQHADYVKKALTEFRSGVRSNDPQGMMRVVTERMSDAEIEAVASYIQGLH